MTQVGSTQGHTAGPWHFTVKEYRNEIRRVEGWVIAEAIQESAAANTANAALIALAPTAPHDCGDPACPGVVNLRRLEVGEELLAALEGCYGERGMFVNHDHAYRAAAAIAAARALGMGGKA